MTGLGAAWVTVNGTFSQDCGGLRLKRSEESYRKATEFHIKCIICTVRMVRKKLLTAYSRCFISTNVNAIVIQLNIVKKQSGIKTKKNKNIFVKKDYMFEKLCDSNYFCLYITVRVCFNYDRI